MQTQTRRDGPERFVNYIEFEMGTKSLNRQLPIDTLIHAIDNREIKLFSAFSLANPELFVKEPPIGYDFLSNLTNEFCRYKEELEAMGKHPFTLDNNALIDAQQTEYLAINSLDNNVVLFCPRLYIR